ncbi:hypothetical protein QBC38DRAFT_366323 [Podospora fimiseda]|uniref:Calpain catalytic domain-containing protein n=1 Tax=Podospora fimiseda TaxID=252190 RepID=A0AAN7BNB9_9PEZI|nr:hypothetical protein QBC38DRAFT_366323 [Podospora fimiseda]
MSSKADGKGGPRPPSPPGPIFPPHLLPRGPSNPAQTMVDLFWARFTARNPGKATTLLPKNELAQRLSKRTAAKDLAGGDTKTTSTSYEEAAAACREKVAQIVRECRRVNQKYRDPHFDLDYDLKNVGHPNCLRSLGSSWADYSSGPDSGTEGSPAPRRKGRPKKIQEGERRWRLNPRSVKRVSDIFDDPKFYIEGPTANDIRQGADGDCWFMAAICALTNKPGLIERVCVARDEKVGVYGFVFHRDGEWISEIIDDKLYLKKPDYEEKNSAGSQRNFDRLLWDEMDHRQDPDEHYRKTFQRNSTALYFAQCEHKNETWLPLLEKAYAKAHGDYAAIDGGFTGEGIEDLTGGVTSELFTADILDPELFWKDGLMKVNDEYLFGCSTGDWRGFGERKGIQELHAYSVLEAREVDGHRLVLLKNPWGRGEWQGAWSDGSKEWTPERMQKLNHRFGDDGAFWISYKDLLRKYQHFDRTRLFDDKWKVTSMWTTLNVSWAPDYHDTKFAFTLEKSGPVVIVLSQLDDRYFRGFEGPYSFGIGFRLHKAGEKEYLVRAQTTYRMTRSCNVELHLEAGEYTVLVRIDAKRTDGKMHPEEVIRQNTKERREKLLRIAMSYDLAHSKAKIVKMPEEKEAREKHEKKQNERYRQKILKREKNELQRQYQQECRRFKIEAKKRAHEFAWTKRHHEKLEAKWRAAEEARQKEWEREQAEMRPAGRNGRGDGKCKLPIEKGQPEAEAKVENGNSVPSSSTDLGENTPSASTNDTLKTDVVENDAEKTDNAGIETQEDLPADELAGKTRHRHHHRRYPHYHNNHHHRRGPPPPPPPPPQGFEDSEPESMMPPCSPLEVSEAELDSMVEENEREAHRIIHTDRGPFVRPPPGAPGPGPGGPIFPWNAVAVVGLRIYYKIDDEDGEGKEGVKLKVVRPILYYDSESDDECKDHHEKGECDEWEVKKEVEENKVLDIDDSAKDAIEEVEGRAKE